MFVPDLMGYFLKYGTGEWERIAIGIPRPGNDVLRSNSVMANFEGSRDKREYRWATHSKIPKVVGCRRDLACVAVLCCSSSNAGVVQAQSGVRRR